MSPAERMDAGRYREKRYLRRFLHSFIRGIASIPYCMAKSLSILFVTSEVVPFAKTGGLADVSSALPLALTELGHDVRIVAPKYGTVSERRNRIHEIKRLKDIPIEVAGESTMATVKSSQVVNSRAKVQVYLVTNDKYLEPLKGIYTDPKTGKDFPSNDERFIFFQKAVLETCHRLGWRPDIIHCNDWQTALIPVFLKELYANDNFFAHTRTVFTVHNMAYQGVFPASTFAKTGLPAELMSEKWLEHGGKVNFLKAGIIGAEALTTVSPTYAKEITGAEHGCGLEAVVKKNREKLTGISNGIDTEVWNPATDKLIDTKYTAETLEQKFENKSALAGRFKKEADVDRPIISMIARMVEQKGYDLLLEAIDEIMKMGVQLFVMGEGEKKYQTGLEKAMKKHRELAVEFGYDETLAHLMVSGSDMLIMPSKFEPSGLNQLYALAYGTAPIVHRTGGLGDTVTDYNAKKGVGNGFVFTEYSTDGLVTAIRRGVELFSDEEKWEQLQRSMMSEDHSWKASAEQYLQIYRSL
jgi:starch synthase